MAQGRTYQMAFELRGKVAESFNNAIKGAAGAMSGLERKTRELKDSQGKLARFQNLDALYKRNRETYGAQAAKVSGLIQKMKETKNPTQAMRKEFDEARKVLKGQEERLKKNADGLLKMRKELLGSGLNLANAAREAQNLKDKLQRIEGAQRAFGRVREGAAPLIRDLRLVGAVAAGAAVAVVGLGVGLMRSASQFGERAERIRDVSKMLGLSTAAYQEMAGAASMAGVKQEAFESSMGQFVKRLGEARQGSGQMIGQLGGLNQGLAVTLISAKDNEQAFMAAVKGLAAVSGPAERAAQANLIFGKSAQGILPFLNRGAAGVAELRNQFRKAGGVISEKDLKRAEAFDDQMDRLTATMKGLKNSALSAIVPVAAKLAAQFQTYVDKHGPEIRKTIENIGRALSDVSGPALRFAGDFISTAGRIASAVGRVVEAIGGMKTVMAIAGGIFAGKIIGDIALFVVALKDAQSAIMAVKMTMDVLKLAMLKNPVTAIAVAITTAAVLIYTHWDKVTAAFEKAWNWIKKIVDKIGLENFTRSSESEWAWTQGYGDQAGSNGQSIKAGLGDLRGVSQVKNSQSSNANTLNFSPTINVKGGDSAGIQRDIRAGLGAASANIMDEFKKAARREQRLRYATGE